MFSCTRSLPPDLTVSAVHSQNHYAGLIFAQGSDTEIMCTGVREERWLVHNALGGGRARRMAVEDPLRGLMPWVGVAAPLDAAPVPTWTPLDNGHAPGLPADGEDAAAAAHKPLNGVMAAAVSPAVGTVSAGRAFCFLPLPIYTGMPPRVHINGYFELSSNRRDIWCVCFRKAAASQHLATNVTFLCLSVTFETVYGNNRPLHKNSRLNLAI